MPILPALLASVLPLVPQSSAAPGERPFPLMVGDPAPALSVARWIQGAPVVRFEPGRTYVVEFWATWCGPCIRSMPHLSELQRDYGERVTIIGIDVWEPDLAKVEPFVHAQRERMTYRVAVDDVGPAPADCDNPTLWSSEHGRTSLAWLHASGWAQEGIPVAFAIDGQGRVAWIGEPRELDGPLAELVAGRHDLARASAHYRREMQARVASKPIQERLGAAQRRHDFRAVVAGIDELLALDPLFASYAGGKFQTLLLDLEAPEEAYAFARAALTGVAKDDVSALGQIAYVIVFMGPDPIEEELALARAAATRANELAHGERPGVLDTLARVHFLSDEPEQALEVQKRAVALAHDAAERSELEQRLHEYERALGG